MQAVRCPVCGGSGEYTRLRNENSTGVPIPAPCHGCNGRGWVEVGCVPYPVPYYPPSYPIYPSYDPWGLQTWC